jgi:ABC-type nitrate/sulfonate/bicarbonate transport system permease component
MVASQNFDTAAVFAMILIIGLLGVGLTRMGQSIENRFARWRN